MDEFQDEIALKTVSPTIPNTSTNPTVKLATIRMTPFSGNPEEWIEFKATCEAVLVDSVPEIQRLQQLKDTSVGEPRQIVSQVLPFDGAYNKAMKLLKDTYESTRAIVDGQ